MSQQTYDEFDLPERAIDLTGQKFGELTAIRPIGKNELGVRWLCRCVCGRTAIRAASYLRRQRGSPCCQECLEELRRGSREDYLRAAREHYVTRFIENGSLYSESELNRFTDQIRDEVAERLGVEVDQDIDINLTVAEGFPYGPDDQQLARDARKQKETEHARKKREQALAREQHAEMTRGQSIDRAVERAYAQLNADQRLHAAGVVALWNLKQTTSDQLIDRAQATLRWGLIAEDWKRLKENSADLPGRWTETGWRHLCRATDVWLVVYCAGGRKLIEAFPENHQLHEYIQDRGIWVPTALNHQTAIWLADMISIG